MVKKSLLEELFKSFLIERWNDKIRPVALLEMDKHAHKMIIAYILAKYEEKNGAKICWDSIIKGGIFELLRRIVLSDIKSPVFREIKKDKDLVKEINQWVYNCLEPKIGSKIIKNEIKQFLLHDEYLDPQSTNILEAAHIYSSYWEFLIIQKTDPFEYQVEKIKNELEDDIKGYSNLIGIKKLIEHNNIEKFINLCGQLRFQMRWGQTARLPKTSVLGHCMFVACVTYFFSLDINSCSKRLYNNFFGGLFHDLPEAVTRDIISPVKKSVVGLPEAIKHIEMNWAEKEIYPFVENEWVDELKFFSQNEFESKIQKDGNLIYTNSNEISNYYNDEKYNPYDGELIRVVDELSAFMEAWYSFKLGLHSDELIYAMHDLKRKYEYFTIAGIPINELYADF